MTTPTNRTRAAGTGQYERGIDTATRDAEAARLRARGLTYQAIADQLGFCDKSAARQAVQRALAAVPAEAAEEVRKIELERLDAALVRLDDLEAEARKVLARKHITVNNGRIIRLDDEPLEDDGPVLAAIDRLVKIEEARQRNSESRRKLLGLDTPVRADVTVHRVDPQDLALAELLNEARAKAAAEEAALKGEDRG